MRKAVGLLQLGISGLSPLMTFIRILPLTSHEAADRLGHASVCANAATPMASVLPRLIVRDTFGSEREVEISGTPFSLARQNDNDLVLLDNRISRVSPDPN